MPNEFHTLGESLKKFLVLENSDSYNVRNTNFGKFNNLKIFIEPARNPNPHFCVHLGISEAMFDLESGEKVLGGLGSDERLVRRWLDRSMNRSDLLLAWTKAKKEMSKSSQDVD